MTSCLGERKAILAMECLVEDCGWDTVLYALIEMAATVPDGRFEEMEELLEAATTVSEGKGQSFVLQRPIASLP